MRWFGLEDLHISQANILHGISNNKHSVSIWRIDANKLVPWGKPPEKEEIVFPMVLKDQSFPIKKKKRRKRPIRLPPWINPDGTIAKLDVFDKNEQEMKIRQEEQEVLKELEDNHASLCKLLDLRIKQTKMISRLFGEKCFKVYFGFYMFTV